MKRGKMHSLKQYYIYVVGKCHCLRDYRFKRNQEIVNYKTRKKLAHVTYYIAKNSGDTMLSYCVRKLFTFDFYKGNWKLISVGKEVDQTVISWINQCSAVIIGGGGLFLPDTNANQVSGWVWSISKEQLKQIKVPIIVFSVGYNYFRGQDVSKLFISNINALIEKASFVGLRNSGSVKAIRSIVDEQLKEKVVYQPCTTTLLRKIYVIPPKKETRKIAVNMAFDRAKMRYGNNKEVILSQVGEAIKKIERKGYSIYFIMHCESDGLFIPYLKKLNIRFKKIDATMWLPEKLIYFYNEIDLVIGMRGHSQMIPFGLNCEILSLGSHEKIRWFLEDIDACDWYIELTEEPEYLAEKIVKLFTKIHETDQKITRERLIVAQDKLWDITRNNLERIKELDI